SHLVIPRLVALPQGGLLVVLCLQMYLVCVNQLTPLAPARRYHPGRTVTAASASPDAPDDSLGKAQLTSRLRLEVRRRFVMKQEKQSTAPKPVEQPAIRVVQRPRPLRIEALEERVAPALFGPGR